MFKGFLVVLLFMILNFFIWLIFLVISFGFLVVFVGSLGDIDLFVRKGGLSG